MSFQELYLCMRNTGDSGQKMEAFKLLREGKEVGRCWTRIWQSGGRSHV